MLLLLLRGMRGLCGIGRNGGRGLCGLRDELLPSIQRRGIWHHERGESLSGLSGLTGNLI